MLVEALELWETVEDEVLVLELVGLAELFLELRVEVFLELFELFMELVELFIELMVELALLESRRH